MRECPKSKDYKGDKAPVCNAGNGCDRCWLIWRKEQTKSTEQWVSHPEPKKKR